MKNLQKIKDSISELEFINETTLGINGNPIVEAIDEYTIKICTKGKGQIANLNIMDFEVVVRPLILRTMRRFR